MVFKGFIQFPLYLARTIPKSNSNIKRLGWAENKLSRREVESTAQQCCKDLCNFGIMCFTKDWKGVIEAMKVSLSFVTK